MSGIGAYLIVLRVRGSAPEWGAGVSDVAAGDAVAAVAVGLCDEQLAAVLRRGGGWAAGACVCRIRSCSSKNAWDTEYLPNISWRITVLSLLLSGIVLSILV